MNPDQIAAHVRERSGIEIQAVTLVRSGNGDVTMPSVWAAMTELGHFWAVENGQRIELFRAVARKTPSTDMTACHSAIEAARRFLLLHPATSASEQLRAPATQQAESGLDTSSLVAASLTDESGHSHIDARQVCQACGVTLSDRSQRARARSASTGRTLCARCRHAEHERLRYQQDPSYRARRLAYSAARYRKSQAVTSPER